MGKESELILEREKLKDTREWIKFQVDSIENNEKELKTKIASLKKASHGSYSEELETSLKLYDIVYKNLSNYKDSYEEPYFARIDFREYRKEKESYYIGKIGLGDMEKGEEIVIDWRAPIADLYYSGSEGDSYYTAPIGVISGDLSLKRRFLYNESYIKDIFDEGINDIILRNVGSVSSENVLVDEFLKINLEKSTGSKLKDVVATIQKEQNAIIRAEKSFPIIVQGSAGSGKTTVALHRLAYLLYRYKNKISGEDILVLAPNKLFLDYISEVLPSLGVDKVKQSTFEDISLQILNIKKKVVTKDKKLSFILEEDHKDIKYITNSSKVKGSMVFKTMLDRYIQILERKDGDIQDIKVDDYVLFQSKDIKKLFLKDMTNLPINKRKEEIKRYLKLKLRERISDVMDRIDFFYEYSIARTKKTMEDGAERRKRLIEIYDERDEKKKYIKKEAQYSFDRYFKNWGNLNSESLYYEMFEDEDMFYQVTGDKIPKVLAEYMIKDALKSKEDNIIDSDDLCAMLYIKFKIEGVPEKYKFAHVVIDEAQDYSYFQLETLKNIAQGESFTIVGDLGQGIYYYKGIEDWNKVIEEIFNNNCSYMPLMQSYRSTVEIIEFANKVLKKQKNNLDPAKPVLRQGKEPEIIKYKNNKEFAEKLDNIVDEVYKLGKNSVAIVGRTYKECKKISDHMKKYSKNAWTLIRDGDEDLDLKRIIIPSYMTKGLEFDCTVVYNCNKENYSEEELDKRLLYVVLTRALHLEYVFYTGEKSPLLE
ncbi:UvrD-helicase domain-containing protein [Clostridium sp. MSJ-4]|uniref:UvrD-helicase domain-containing protein n=1 Tax=Clostridium simiarum TaxID=2841506 RepID=A0ABS6F2S8_9CLOT|nr:RNA polymerase recycling motor HelD [Clostridium simiarum]MBU5592812.1 UvrD-helicase domain-containing protein [Clostridium simiarum]